MQNAENTEIKKRGIKKLDLIIIGALLLISLLSILFLNTFKKPGSYARIELDGEVVAILPLDENAKYEVNGGTNVVSIINGKAYMEYADCPDHTCILSGEISYGGESVICLPNRVAIIIVSEEEGVDLVS